VSSTRELSGASANVTAEQWLKDERARARAAALAAVTTAARMDEHPALQVASGGYDVCVFFTAGPWDLAAPAIVVEEAGGRFSDLEGGRTLTAGAVFSNGLVHDPTLSLLARAGEGIPR
jgi:histidinol-phosphatase